MAPKSKNDEIDEETEVEEMEDNNNRGGSWAEGLAKGVFACKGNRSKRPRSISPKKKAKKLRVGSSGDRKTAKIDNMYLEQSLASKYPVWASERVEVHNRILREVEERVEHIQKEIFSGVYNSIFNFVLDSQKLRHTTIPTAVLLTGVNMPDHALVFGRLVDRLREATPHIALLSAGQNLKQMVTSLVMDLAVNSQDEEDEEVECALFKKSDASFQTLVDWYTNQYPTSQRPPLVLVLQDLENFSGSCLADLITLCTRYLSSLPLVLVVGVATTISAFHRLLPQATTAKLTINTFGSPNASRHLEEVIEQVLLHPALPFKLSAKVFQFLLENFLFHDFSVNHFMAGYRFILSEHFHRIPAAILAQRKEESLKRLEVMNLQDMSHICRLQSFKEHMENLNIEDQAEILVNEMRCREEIRNLLEDHYQMEAVFAAMVRGLFHLARDLPRRPLGRLLRDVHLLAAAGGIETTPQYREAFQFLKLSNRTDLESKLANLVAELTGLEPCRDFLAGLVKIQERLSQLDTEEEGQVLAGSPAVVSLTARFNSSSNSTPLTSNTNTPAGSCLNSPSTGSKPGGKLDRYQLQASLLEAVQRNNQQQLRPFDRIRSELMGLLHENLKRFLVPPTTRPLHEIFTFSATGAVRRHLVGAPRAALHTALTDPHLYLEHDDLKISDPGEIPATFPDICIGYKLHLECPRLINVFDWLTCWHSILHQAEDNSISKEDQARFTRIVSELQHLGFIKTSNRKTDHVARLTFGGS